jgi:hypothetical protein
MSDESVAVPPTPPEPVSESVPEFSEPKAELKPLDLVAKEVLEGEWGYGQERRVALVEAGYDLDEVRVAIKNLLNPKT